MSLAGISENGQSKESAEEVYSFAIITTDANELMATIHILIMQAFGGKCLRRRSIIRSSWYTVSKYGKHFCVFEKYSGIKELQEVVVNFLNLKDED